MSIASREAPLRSSIPQDRSGVGWVVGGVLSLIVLVVLVWTSSTDVPPKADLQGAPSPAQPLEPLFGITNFPALFQWPMIVMIAVMGFVYTRACIREGRMNRTVIVMAAALVLVLLDPLGNWVQYAVFDPRLLHPNPEWAWISIAPNVEPLINVPGYPLYYAAIGLLGVTVSRKVIARSARKGPTGWAVRHPLWTTFMVSMGIGGAMDCPLELYMLRAEVLVYTEHWGPVISWSGAEYPIIFGMFNWPIMAMCGVLLVADDSGRSRVLVSLATRRWPWRRTEGRPTSGRQAIMGILALTAVYAGMLAFFAVLRVTDASQPGNQQWRYDTKVYDPYGHQAEHGFPGPYHK